MILKFTLRILSKRLLLNLIKIIGLSLALSGLLIISLFLKNELSYDRSHKKWDRIYRYTFTGEFFGGKHFARVYNASYIPQMQEYFPEIESYVRLAPIRGGFIKYKDKFIDVNEAFECDSTFFTVFNAHLIVGNPDNILDNPGSVVISEKYANKIFGQENPIGKVITLPGGQFSNENVDFTIRGIMKDFPYNMHFHPDFITSPINKSVFNGWAWVYLLLNKNANPESIETKFKSFVASISGTEESEINMDAYLQNISEIHLNSHKLREIEPNGNMTLVYTLAIAAILLLFIALTNYANLNIGMAGFSEKFLYINKISGATNWISIKYALYEGIIITVLTLLTSAIILSLANNMIQQYFGLNIFAHNLVLTLSITLIFIILSIIIGISPIFQKAFNKVNSILNVSVQNDVHKRSISKGLVILQYSITIVLIVAVIIIHRQTQYALNKGMGVENSNLICMENIHSNVQQKFELFKEELLKYESIESVSAMLDPPGGEANDKFRFNMEEYAYDATNNQDSLIGVVPCDYSFASIFNLKFLSGRNFSSKNEDNEGSGEYIINKAAMLRLHYTNPEEIIGKKFSLTSWDNNKIPSGSIIGVVDDFHLSNIKKEVEPLVMFKRKNMWLINFVISFKPATRQKALSEIKSVWTKLFPEYPFQFKYVSSLYRNLYKTELLQTRLLSIFTFIALFICSMGLLGLSLLVAQRRTKEIGIRKVNGATAKDMIIMLNWSLIKWVLVSFVIAVPVAFWVMNKWLENYAYKISLSWWIFALAGFIAFIISLSTVSIIAWKAANNNPVKALRYE